jgi:hypothetical protein
VPVPSSTRPASGESRPTPRTTRWHSLDVLKGLALWAMIAHHFQEWTAGEVDGRFIGFDHFAITDLAPPLFGVGLGAAAVVVGDRLDTWRALRHPSWRWTQIFLVGLAIDLATHEGVIKGRGVLPTLAILGLSITMAVAAGMHQPWAWWAVAVGGAVVAVPATEMVGRDPWHLLVNGPFSLPVYAVFAASGAAVAAHGLGRSEHSLPLVRSAVGVLVVGLVAAILGRGVVAPKGVWPPARYPGHLGFTLWGVVASLLIWAAARQGLGPERALGQAIARAGRRTLLVFAAHYVVRIALKQADLTGQLDTWRWGIVTWAAVAAVCAATTVPSRTRRRA